MNGADALLTLIAAGDELRAQDEVAILRTPEEWDEFRTRLETASAICQAMLNTMMPIARWRAMATFDNVQPRRGKQQVKREIREEFTVCSVSIAGIKAGLQSLQSLDYNVHVSLWEQRQTGADMVTAFQGNTGSQQYRIFLKSLDARESVETVQ